MPDFKYFTKICLSGSMFILVILLIGIYVISLYYPPVKSDTKILGYLTATTVIIYMMARGLQGNRLFQNDLAETMNCPISDQCDTCMKELAELNKNHGALASTFNKYHSTLKKIVKIYSSNQRSMGKELKDAINDADNLLKEKREI